MSDLTAIFEAVEATWPPAASRPLGPFTLRDGAGGGKRVSAATASGPVRPGEIDAAEAAMPSPLFQIRPGQAQLDDDLAARGYSLIDRTAILTLPLTAPLVRPDPLLRYRLWPPLARMEEIWQQDGIGPERRAVMVRVQGPKTAIMGRNTDRATGVLFCAIHGEIAIVHALAVDPAARRQGTATNMMRDAACWAQDNGATLLGTLTLDQNAPARAVFASLGMGVVGHYQYRSKAL